MHLLSRRRRRCRRSRSLTCLPSGAVKFYWNVFNYIFLKWWVQCDQIGRFLKVLGYKCSYKIFPIFADNLGYFEKLHFQVKTAVVFLENFWRKLGHFWVYISGNTGDDPPLETALMDTWKVNPTPSFWSGYFGPMRTIAIKQQTAPRALAPWSIRTSVIAVLMVGQYDTIILISDSRTMEPFSRRRWATGSAQQSSNNGIMPCMWCIIFWVLHKHHSFTLGPIQPSSPNTKELHGRAFEWLTNGVVVIGRY